MSVSLNVRDVLRMSDAQLAQLPIQHTLIYDDQSALPSLRNETRFCALFWSLFNQYPNARILPEHHFSAITKNGYLDANTHSKLCTAIFKTIVKEEHLVLPEQKEPLLERIYEVISLAQNNLAVMTEEDVISLDILDFVQITNHPEILALKQAAMEDQTKIKFAYEGMIHLIKTHPDFLQNNLSKAVKAGMVKENQVVKCIGFIGFPSEVDGTIFDEPIWDNYTTGLTNFYSLVADSRQAAKSHLYSDSALKDSEYNARKFQLYAMVLERIHYEDCGSTNLMPWRVKGETLDASGTVLYSGDISRMAGKHYKLTKDGPYMVIEGNEKHLSGKTIWIRTLLGCQDPDAHCSCHLCAGDISQNISRFDNVGHVGTVTATRVLSQTILSFKHVNTSSVMVAIILGDYEKMYMNTGERGDGFYLNKPKKGIKLSVGIVRDEAPGLLDLTDVDDISQMSLPRISAISIINLHVTTPDGISEGNILKTKTKQAAGMLSREMLAFAAQKGWSVDEENNFMFDMDGWDFSQPLLVVQNKEESVVDLVKQVEQMVQSNQQIHKKRLVVENSPQVLLQELFDLVNSKFHINFFCFEVIVYGLMAYSNESYALSRGSANPVLGILDSMTIHRTLGPAMAYQCHTDALFSPAYFYPGTRPDSTLDVFLTPKEVIESTYGVQS